MATLPQLHGFPVSPNVRAARMAFAEKNVPIAFHEIGLDALAAPDYPTLHPFRKMPALTHGEVSLYETPALMVYADAIGEGPSLQPDAPIARAHMWKFVGVAQHYLYPVGVMRLFFNRVLAPLFGLPVDAKAADEAATATAAHLDVIEVGIAAGQLSADAPHFGDLYCGAMVDYIARTEDGRAMLAARRGTAAWLSALRARPSFAATLAPVLAAN
ncbi:MAG: glutathione S-transferase family protein [Tagaea sp.]